MRLDQVMDTLLTDSHMSRIFSDFLMASSFFYSNTGGFAMCWQLARAKIVCDWRPVAYKLNPSGRQFIASTLREQLFQLKNEDAIKKSKNLRDTCPC
jgi:hypothetical protein